MKKLKKAILIIIIITALPLALKLGGFLNNEHIEIFTDPAIDYSKYRSFSISFPSDGTKDEKGLSARAKDELIGRGYEHREDNADFLVNVKINSSERDYGIGVIFFTLSDEGPARLIWEGIGVIQKKNGSIQSSGPRIISRIIANSPQVSPR